jgi:formylaminopyrimidine deformylase / aminopyrimidine aminohydrolase
MCYSHKRSLSSPNPMSLTCQQLLTTHQQIWNDATVHPFLSQCQTGEISANQFNTWLVQDYWFVAAAPVEHFEVLLAAFSTLNDELKWFRTKAIDRQLDLNTPQHPTCVTYCDYMIGLAAEPYAVQATAYWAIECAYNQGWQRLGAVPEPYTEFADRWGNAGFTAYVAQLQQQADGVLCSASDAVQQQAEQAFLTIARLEQDFWQMAFSAD